MLNPNDFCVLSNREGELMLIIYSILLFIIGLCVGSFLNVLVLRIDNLSTVWRGRSFCPHCKHDLAWHDLIPLFSFAALLGKCRYCKKPISKQYPAVEFGVGVLFLLLFLKFGVGLSLIYYLVIFSILTVVFVYDLKTQMVPEVFVWIALALAFVGGWHFGNFSFVDMILGGLVGGGLFAFLVIVSKETWMGAGDIKIGLIMGFLLGYPVAIFGLFSAFVLGSIVGIIYMKIASKTLKDPLPFAPFIIASILIGMIFGGGIIDWYWGNYLW